MKNRNYWIVALAMLGLTTLAFTSTSYVAPEPTQKTEPDIGETLKNTNRSFKNTEVQIINWPDKLHKRLGNLKKSAFIAFSTKRPSGKLPLLITLHGGGGKEMSLQKQLARSSQVKGLALAELAGKDLILLDPNSSDNWDPDTLDRMLDYVLRTYKEIDKNRIYVMGHSMGGRGTWSWILKSADRFAAAAPCGFPNGSSKEGIENLTKLPIWGMVGGDDGDNVAGIQQMTDNLRAAGNVNVRHTAFPGAKHSQGNAAVFSSVELVDWMLSFSQ